MPLILPKKPIIAAPAPAAPLEPPKPTIPTAAEARKVALETMVKMDVTTFPMWKAIAEKLRIAREEHGLGSVTFNMNGYPVEHIQLLVERLEGLGYAVDGEPSMMTVDWSKDPAEERTGPSVPAAPAG